MSLKSFIGSVWAKNRYRRIKREADEALILQARTLAYLLRTSQRTQFGKEHHFNRIKTYEDFVSRVPIRNYEAFKPYIDKVYKGEEHILWPGLPLYLAKTSGTTSGAKYIPISKDAIQMQIRAARDALLCYLAETGKGKFLDGKMMFLSGSPELDTNEFGMKIGRLSGIVNHFVPSYLQRNKVPTYTTNCIDDWEEKVSTIVKEVIPQDLRLISGIPPWVQMFFEEAEAQTGKKPLTIWPNLQLFVQGGVNFEPYRAIFNKYFNEKVDLLEVYPASEGFFAFQHQQADRGLLLMPNYGIFYEFIPLSEYGKEHPTRLPLAKVELEVPYAIIITTNAGLFAYDIGDTVTFISKDPYKLRVSGRVKHFISAFGEHVIAEEVEHAISEAINITQAEVVEFTVAPFIHELKGKSAHEWFIEFATMPKDLAAFSAKLDQALRDKNIYYDDLRRGNILQPAIVNVLTPQATRNYMKTKGKLGGQNKFPRLSNHRKIAEALTPYILNIHDK